MSPAALRAVSDRLPATPAPSFSGPLAAAYQLTTAVLAGRSDVVALARRLKFDLEMEAARRDDAARAVRQARRASSLTLKVDLHPLVAETDAGTWIQAWTWVPDEDN